MSELELNDHKKYNRIQSGVDKPEFFKNLWEAWHNAKASHGSFNPFTEEISDSILRLERSWKEEAVKALIYNLELDILALKETSQYTKDIEDDLITTQLERDAARLEVCTLISQAPARYSFQMTPKLTAKERGWDYLFDKPEADHNNCQFREGKI